MHIMSSMNCYFVYMSWFAKGMIQFTDWAHNGPYIFFIFLNFFSEIIIRVSSVLPDKVFFYNYVYNLFNSQRMRIMCPVC